MKIGKGSITVYEPNVFLEKWGNIRFCKKAIQGNTKLPKTDLLVGFKPCGGTIAMIDASRQNHIPKEVRPLYQSLPIYRQFRAYIEDYLKESIEKDATVSFHSYSQKESKKVYTFEKTYPSKKV